MSKKGNDDIEFTVVSNDAEGQEQVVDQENIPESGSEDSAIDASGDAPESATAETEDSDSSTPSLMTLIKEQVTEEDADPRKSNLSLRKIIGGEILTAEIVRKNIWLILLITLFLVIYIAEGYSYKKYIVDIDRLNKELRDAKFKSLSVKSDLTEHTRESKILELLRLNNDSTLHRPDRPPYIIEVPEK